MCENECPEVKGCSGTHQLDPECPEGHKCTLDGGIGQTHCVEIVPEPKGLYEPCTSMGDWLSGLDDCGLGRALLPCVYCPLESRLGLSWLPRFELPLASHEEEQHLQPFIR